MSADPYVDPKTGALHNKLGITDAEALARAEADLTRGALQELAVNRLPGGYDLDHLLAFHKAIFGDLYAWAGQVRTVSIAKPGSVFAPPQFIESYAREVFGDLRRENCLRGLSCVDFVPRIAHYYAEINAIHPTREGDGRAQRAFLGQLADDAGWPIAWRRMDAEANIVASQAGQRGELAPLVRMLGELIVGGAR